MITHVSHIRVRYAETDQMGVVYHGNFAAYFETARAEMIREMGLTYKELEAMGVMMPITELLVRYMRPVTYDELIELRTRLETMPDRRIVMHTDVYNAQGKHCVAGQVTLAFIDANTRQSISAPEAFLQILRQHWKRDESNG
jgi:acyl-CoA thioester hydrolase